MNRTDLRDAVAKQTGLSNADADKAITATFDAIAGSLAEREKVSVPGFGVFETRERSARTGRNPQTGASIEIEASTAPAFKAGAALKRAVSGS